MTSEVRIPTVKALAAILDDAGRLLVQCDTRESFYRLPGGSIELGETAALTVVRELQEEFRIRVVVGSLMAVVENRFQAAGQLHHEIALVHRATIASAPTLETRFVHLAHNDIQLVWRELGGLGQRLVPIGLEAILQAPRSDLVHLVCG
jgi:8-oxo-dGTP diphosphatase